MAANDFSAIHAVLPLLITAAQGLWAAVFDPKEATKELTSELAKKKFAQPAFVQKRRDSLRSNLLGPMYLATHLLNFVALVGVIAIVVLGPQTLLSAAAGALAEPLSDIERNVYLLALVVASLIYLAKGLMPMVTGWRAVIKASRHLKEHA
jgi:hypothetical protein